MALPQFEGPTTEEERWAHPGGTPDVYQAILADRAKIAQQQQHENAIAGGQTLFQDPNMRQGQVIGMERGQQAYGQTQDQTGKNVQDIIARRRENLSANSPASDELRRSRNALQASAKARGASEAERSQIDRSAQQGIANQEYSNKQGALNDYQKIIGNVLSGQSQMELGYAGLGKASQTTPLPQQGGGLSGTFGTIICTELYNQGYMNEEMLIKDGEYGRFIRNYRPMVYTGYIVVASPIVLLMKRSKLFTRIVSIPAMAWARNMAGNRNLLGRIISFIGEPLCEFIGGLREVKNQKAKDRLKNC